HSVTLHGCVVHDGALIGMGATVLDHAEVGKGAIVAAGALVLSNTKIGDGELWAGVPAKFIKKVDPVQAAELNQTYARHYIEYSDWFRNADADARNTQEVTTSEDYRAYDD
ncbi:MAG: gamma carbonic anhydrase family protein, partial [Bacteroidaceae bacterium]|nr:gamma carbonic anhydrase family protein [Bacteroidaceae bacterium]